MQQPLAHHEAAKRIRWWIPVLLLLCYTGQCLWFIASQSLTYDEPIHVSAALEVWQYGRFQRANDHPPLVRLWYTIPLLAAHPSIAFNNETGPIAVQMTPGPRAIAWLTRPMNMLLGLALGVLLWCATRHLLSEGAANLALAFFAFSPDCIAHFSLATTDGAGTLFLFLGAWQLVRWLEVPNWARTVQLGILTGGMILSKFYNAPATVAIVLIVLFSSRTWNLLRWKWKPAIAVALLACFTVWAGYWFHVSRIDIDRGHMVATFPNRPAIVKELKWKGNLHLVVPAGELVDGVRNMMMQNHRGRPTWFLGKLYPKGGVHTYYPVAMALKWPTTVLLCAVASLGFAIFRTWRFRPGVFVLMIFPVIHLGLALSSRYNIGIRHVLPVYPFILLLAGGMWEVLRPYRHALVISVLLLLANAADATRYAPNYLAHFNAFVGRDQGWRLLGDSNLDWGEGLLALRNYQQSHPGEELQLAYFGGLRPELYGIRYRELTSTPNLSGTIVVSTSRLIGHALDDPEGIRWRREHQAGAQEPAPDPDESYEWLTAYRPAAVLDHCLFVYKLNR